MKRRDLIVRLAIVGVLAFTVLFQYEGEKVIIAQTMAMISVLTCAMVVAMFISDYQRYLTQQEQTETLRARTARAENEVLQLHQQIEEHLKRK